MAPSPQCSALNAAMARTGLSYSAIAAKTGQSESHIIAICTGAQDATPNEYNALAVALDIKSPIPHNKDHKA